MILDGFWKFAFLNDYPEDISSLSFDDELLVPGCFDMDERYRFAHGIGAYARQVKCGGFVKLEIGGIGLCGRVYFDGRLLGEIETAYMAVTYRFEAGEDTDHQLVILTDNRFHEAPSANFYEWYDIYGYGGIYRSVKLTPEKHCWFDQLAVATLDYRTGQMRLRAALGGELPATPLTCTVCRRGQKLASCTFADDGTLETTFTLPDFRLWTADTPNLDTVTVQAGDLSQEVTFGVRQIDWHSGKITINGKPVKLLGYNRHDAHPDFGCAIPYAEMARDLRMIKQQGANFIRGCHYPQSEELLDLCDRLGIMLWDESLGWGDTPESLTDPEFIRKTLAQTRAMVRRSLNHPCIVIWGFLNEMKSKFESSRGIVQQLVDLIHHEDDTRPTTFASCARDEDKCQDIPDVVSINTYPSWYYSNTNAYFSQDDLNGEIDFMLKFVNGNFPGKPVIISEIGATAIPGGYEPVRGSEQYQAQLDTEAMRRTWTDERLSGIALWQFCDNRTKNITGGPFAPLGFNTKGVVDAYRHPKYAWITLYRFFIEIGWVKQINERLKDSIAN